MAGHIGDMVSQHWTTPAYLVEAVQNAVGQIGLDPCYNKDAITDPMFQYSLPGFDGLKESWVQAGGSPIPNVFCNPPYGRDKERGTSIADWVRKAHDVNARAGQTVVLLIPAATEASFWFKYIWRSPATICFLKGRVAFNLGGTKTGSSTRGSAVVYYGPKPDVFRKVFSELGAVVHA